MRLRSTFLRLVLWSVFAFFVAVPLVTTGSVATEAHAKKKKKKKSKAAAKTDDKAKDAKADEKTAKDGKAAAKGKKGEKDAAAEGEEKKEPEPELRTTGPARLKVPEAKKTAKKDLTEKAEKKRDEQIEEIKGLLPRVNAEQKGELIFRLAELFWQKSQYIYQSEFTEFDETYQAWVDNGRQGKEPELDGFTKKSEAYKKQALNNYAVVLDEYPDYPRLDEVLYIMAYNEYQAGKKDAAVKNYSKLIRQYPESEYVADSYLALGEHYFGENNLAKATKAYNRAYTVGKEKDKPGTYRYAQYKLAWCDYNAQEYDKALTKFKDVIEESEKSEKQAGRGDKDDPKGAVQLKREALNDMVLTYSQLDAVEEAYEYMKKKAGKEEAYRLTSKLAGIYDGQGKSKQQIATLRHLINLDPDHVSAPDYQSQVVAAYSKLGDRDAVRKEVTRLVELYRPGSSWWKKNESNKTAVERARTVAETRMRELVTDYHRYAQKFKRYDDYELARDLYGEYLQAFPDSPDAYNLNFYYAEILWDLGQWQDAAVQYDAVVGRDEKGKYTRDCAFNSILAWEKIVKGEKPPVRNKNGELSESDKGKKGTGVAKERVVIEDIKEGQTYEKQKIPFAEEKLANACDAYVRVVPEAASKGDAKLAEELVTVKFKSAYIFHKYYHFDQAADRFGELIRRWPETEFARRGADAILDSYAARTQWVPLEKWSREFAKNEPLMKEEKFATAVYKFMQGASFKAIEEVYQAGRATEKKAGKKTPEVVAAYDQSADRFVKFVEEFPKSEFAATAMYNAMDIYDGASKLDLALKGATHLVEKYPKEINEGALKEAKVEEKLKLNFVRYHEKMANYLASAEAAIAFVDKYPKHEKAPDVLYNAGIFYLGLGDTANAVKQFARYIKDYPTQADVPDVYLRMALVFEDGGEWVKASTLYESFEKNHGKQAKPEQILSSRYKTALMLSKAGREDQSLEVCKNILTTSKKDELKKTDIGQIMGGYCAFKVLEPEFVAFKAVKIETRETGKSAKAMKKAMAEVKESLDAKKKGMEDVGKKYVDVLTYGNGEWGVAGLYRAAQVLLDYVDTLRNAPDPPALADNFDALDIYRTELDTIAFPVEDQAIQALEKALEKAFELGIYSEYTLAIENTLRQFRPQSFGEIYEMPFYPSSGTGDAVPTTQTARR